VVSTEHISYIIRYASKRGWPTHGLVTSRMQLIIYPVSCASYVIARSTTVLNSMHNNIWVV